MKKVLIIKHGALGDLIQTTGIFKSIREAHQDDHVTLLVDKKFDFFEDEEAFMQEAATTPRSNCVLDSSKLESAGIFLRPVEEAVRSSIREMKLSSSTVGV